MNKKFTRTVAIVLAALIFLSALVTAVSVLADEMDDLGVVQDKLSSITEEEREILEYLFIQMQEIDMLEREEDNLNIQLTDLTKRIYNLEDIIYKEELSFNNNKDVLKSVLQTYQTIGPASHLEVLLKSESLKVLLRNINILRDLAKNTDELLISIEESKEKLELERDNLKENLEFLEEIHIRLVENLDSRKKIVEEKEEYLVSLLDEREYYEEYLATIKSSMEELKSLVRDLSHEFSTIIEKGNLPQDAFKPSFSLQGIKGTIDEEVFNNIIDEHEGLPEVKMIFDAGKVEMHIPEENLVFVGDFIIEDKQIIRYDIEHGSFYGMTLEKATIADLFKDGELLLDLEPILGKNVLKSIETYSGFIELVVQLKF